MKECRSQTRRRAPRRFDRDTFRELLDDKGYSLRVFADAIGVSYSGLRKIAVGSRQPSPHVYRLIITHLRLPEGSLRVDDEQHREAA
jgi:transcriptional regulator with XRE-family HTH domain